TARKPARESAAPSYPAFPQSPASPPLPRRRHCLAAALRRCPAPMPFKSRTWPRSAQLEPEQLGRVQPENLLAVRVAQPAVEADRVGLRHVERIVGAETQLVGAVRPHQAVELVLVEHQRVEP